MNSISQYPWSCELLFGVATSLLISCFTKFQEQYDPSQTYTIRQNQSEPLSN